MKARAILIVLIVSAAVYTVASQTTEFTYQGSLNDGASPATGSYDLQFLLFDSVSGGTQVGSTISKPAVRITNGVFSVRLDFGSQFTGSDRYLEIRVRTVGGTGYTILDPRQRVTSSPYSVKSLSSTTADNALSLGGVPANQYVTSPVGNDGYIRNSNFQQPSSDFNISGNGSAGGMLSATVINSMTQYNLSGERLLGSPSGLNLFVGIGAGTFNTGQNNSFFGDAAGYQNTSGSSNSFFGREAGRKNLIGNNNSFFGWHAGFNSTNDHNSFFGANAGLSNTGGPYGAFFGDSAGYSNTDGQGNSFFGYHTGFANTTGNFNTFIGEATGGQNTTGDDNSFFGHGAGALNTAGHSNTFIGTLSGYGNTTGSWNTTVGNGANVGSGDLANATAIGNAAYVTQSNSLVLGAINGINGAGSSTNVGIGTTAPKARLHIVGGSIFIAQPNSLIITSPDGHCWFITVNNSGALGANPVTCP